MRLPAHLTASGRAILAALPANQVRALYPDRTAFVQRHGVGPTSLGVLRDVLAEARRRGYATEVEEISPGMSSVAAPVADHNGLPLASVAVTYEGDLDPDPVVARVRGTAATVTRRLLGP